MRKTRKYYQKLFRPYPDLVTVLELRQMLGGIGDVSARRLIHEKKVISFYVKPRFLIPKSSVIDYLLSEGSDASCHKR